jgi:hypothetical protein
MKPIVFIMGLFICSLSLSAQTFQENQKGFPSKEKVKSGIISELYFSVNRTLAGEDERRWGGGIGIDHSFHLGKVVEFLLGSEYYHASELYINYSMYPGASPPRNSEYFIVKTITNLDCFSIPTGFRYNVGKEFKVFFEHGAYYDLTISSRRTETRENKTSNERYKQNTNYPIHNAPGFYFGIGARIPSKRVEYLVKSDIKVRFDQGEIPFILKLDVGLKWK